MLQYFFIYGSELPQGTGFAMFGAEHLIWLALGAVATAALAMLYHRFCIGKKSIPDPEVDPEGCAHRNAAGVTGAEHAERTAYGGRRTRRMDLAIGSFLLALIVIRDIYLLIIGYLTIYELPFHLCSMAGIFCFLHSLKNWDWMGQVLYCLCFPGTIVALVFPDWNYYPPVHFITIQGFLFHFGVALYVICQLVSGRICPNIRKLWKVFVFLAITVPLLYIFNKHFDTNYFFLNIPSKGSPLEWIASFMGNPGYLIGYGILAIVITSGLDGLYHLLHKNRSPNKTDIESSSRQ